MYELSKLKEVLCKLREYDTKNRRNNPTSYSFGSFFPNEEAERRAFSSRKL